MKLISCIMPTRGRREFARQALDCFLRQTYVNRELIIMDDHDDPSFPEPPQMFGVHYWLWQGERLTIPKKRNACCKLANGDYIAHFDSDDYSDPERLAVQMKLAEESGKAVTGFHSMPFYDERTKKAYRFASDGSYAIGTSLMYRRDFWLEHNFRPGRDNPNVGEDNLFMGAARDCGQLHSVDAGKLMVARVHDDSTSPHDFSQVAQIHGFTPVSLDVLPEGFPR